MEQRANAASTTQGRRLLVRSGFFPGTAIAAFATVCAGFGPSILDSAGRSAPLTELAILHALVFTAWLALYLTQTTLVAAGRTDVHRRLGLIGAVLAPIMIGVGYLTAIAMARRGFDLSGDLRFTDPLAFLVFPLGDLLTFSTLVAAGFWYRRRPAIHKRAMLLAVFGGLMAAPLTHLLGHAGAPAPLIVPVLAAFQFASAIHDRIVDRRIHPLSLWGGVVLFIWGNVRAVVIAPSAWWHQLAAWLVG